MEPTQSVEATELMGPSELIELIDFPDDATSTERIEPMAPIKQKTNNDYKTEKIITK